MTPRNPRPEAHTLNGQVWVMFESAWGAFTYEAGPRPLPDILCCAKHLDEMVADINVGRSWWFRVLGIRATGYRASWAGGYATDKRGLMEELRRSPEEILALWRAANPGIVETWEAQTRPHAEEALAAQRRVRPGIPPRSWINQETHLYPSRSAAADACAAFAPGDEVENYSFTIAYFDSLEGAGWTVKVGPSWGRRPISGWLGPKL